MKELLITLIFGTYLPISSEPIDVAPKTTEHIPVPDGYTLIEHEYGDLTNDQKDELAVVYNTSLADPKVEAIEREIIIYKHNDNNWQKWKSSKTAIMHSLSGGDNPLWTDPYDGINIHNNALYISHFSNFTENKWIWAHHDTYRLIDGELQLAKYQSTHSSLCEGTDYFNIDIVSGKTHFYSKREKCEDIPEFPYTEHISLDYKEEKFTNQGIKIFFEDRQHSKTKITTPEHGVDLYL